jgi:hypothetical protein
MVDPFPGLAPVIPPVIVPMVHIKVLGIEEVNVIPGAVPLQIVVVAALVITGRGLTVTVIVKGWPVHKPAVALGVTIYSTVPLVRLLGFVSD